MSTSEIIKIWIPDRANIETKQAEIEGWIGRAYHLTRKDITKRQETDEIENSAGVYFLLGEEYGENAVYIGKSEHVYKRVREHLSDQDKLVIRRPNFYWNIAILFVSKVQDLHTARIQWLENETYCLAKKNGRYKVMNKQTPTRSGMADMEKESTEMFLTKIKLILENWGFPFLKPLETQENKGTKEIALFTKNQKGASGKAIILEDEFIVLKGSRVTGSFTTSTPTCFIRKWEALNAKGVIKNNVFVKNYPFTSPSTAGVVILGRNVNGRTVWKDENGRTLKEIEEN